MGEGRRTVQTDDFSHGDGIGCATDRGRSGMMDVPGRKNTRKAGRGRALVQQRGRMRMERIERIERIERKRDGERNWRKNRDTRGSAGEEAKTVFVVDGEEREGEREREREGERWLLRWPGWFVVGQSRSPCRLLVTLAGCDWLAGSFWVRDVGSRWRVYLRSIGLVCGNITV